jgi:hypothetical protein
VPTVPNCSSVPRPRRAASHKRESKTSVVAFHPQRRPEWALVGEAAQQQEHRKRKNDQKGVIKRPPPKAKFRTPKSLTGIFDNWALHFYLYFAFRPAEWNGMSLASSCCWRRRRKGNEIPYSENALFCFFVFTRKKVFGRGGL